jgi:hypothetical protein
MSAARFAGLFFVLLTAGCAALECASPDDPLQTGATKTGAGALDPVVSPPTAAPEPSPQTGATQSDAVALAPVILPPPATASPEWPPTSPAQDGAATLEPVAPPAAPPETPPSAQPAVSAEPTAAKTPAKVIAPPVPAAAPEQLRHMEGVAPKPAKQETPPLDLKSLETRLRQTKAIGVFTKLTLKNQVDDLLGQFRAYYEGRLKTTLAELRRPYDLLLLKVLALLQDADPPLAGAIVASREAMWDILSDPVKFKTI